MEIGYFELSRLLKNRVLNKENLFALGFQKDGEKFVRVQTIFDGFTVFCEVFENSIFFRLKDSDGEPYILHNVQTANGEFVGKIRAELLQIAQEIAEKGFDKNVFSSSGANFIVDYAKRNFQSKPEFLWEKFDDTAIFRRADSKKWFALICTLDKQKLGILEGGRVEILDVRVEKDSVQNFVDNKRFFPGWHLNKRTWLTVLLDGSVSNDEIARLLDKAFDLVAPKQKKRKI